MQVLFTEMLRLAPNKRVMRSIIKTTFFLAFILGSNAALSQEKFLIQGKVSDENGSPLVGASVYNPTTLRGTVTDAQGNYSIKVKAGQFVLKTTYVGYNEVIDTINVMSSLSYDIQLRQNAFLAKEVLVEATRASKTTPMAVQNISKEEIEALNLAQDMPILLNQTVSTVTTSDAGAGVGYTGIRVRGSDGTRINVTVNGVPLNDQESHGVFWVNMPDFASSTENIQIQRGVGSSSNGAAAFGATINLQTSDFDSTGYVEMNNTIGSFNTRRHNVILNSGLLNDHFQFEGRLSYIGSDGYIDRSAADLRSYYFGGGYYGDRLMVKGLTFAGREITQQAWYGTPESRLNDDEEAMLSHAANNGYNEIQTQNLLNSGRTYNYYTYDNEIDNYAQDHYQLLTGYAISDKLYLSLTGHYTYGRGYFEQFKGDDDLAAFGLSYPIIGSDTITTGDVIVRRWLENHFYGAIFSLQYNGGAHRLTWGGSANEYLGDHFGEVIWSSFAPENDIRDRYYESTSKKQDAATYIKWEYGLKAWSFYLDMQGRYIDYRSAGIDNDLRPINIDQTFFFFNPKAGLNYRIKSGQRLYASVARSSREPVRSDFTDAAPGVVPRPEFLTDLEFGWEINSDNISLALNGYYMHYKDQLVLTGEVNDVGAPVRTNVPVSYRAGIEASLQWKVTEKLTWLPNATFSQNKIAQFTEILYDYTEGFDIIEIEHNQTDIAFSPNLIVGSQVAYRLFNNLQLTWLSKYVGRQFLDNTSNLASSIPAYWVNDFKFSYQPQVKMLKMVSFDVLVNNFLNERYAANGYTFSYVFGERITENFYYPQATTNVLVGLKLRF